MALSAPAIPADTFLVGQAATDKSLKPSVNNPHFAPLHKKEIGRQSPKPTQNYSSLIAWLQQASTLGISHL